MKYLLQFGDCDLSFLPGPTLFTSQSNGEGAAAVAGPEAGWHELEDLTNEGVDGNQRIYFHIFATVKASHEAKRPEDMGLLS